MKRRLALVATIALLGMLVAIPTVAQEKKEDEKAWNRFQINDALTLSLNGYLYVYHIRNHHCYFTSANAAFTEITGALGVDLAHKDELNAQIRLVGTGLYGRPENYLGVAPQDMDVILDLANVSWHGELLDRKIHLTAGLQELKYGDGFLVMDGFSETRAIWTTPIRSFPAVKASVDVCENSKFDVFAAHVRNDFVSYEALLGAGQGFQTGGSLSGANLHLGDCCGQTLDFAVFVKEEDSDAVTGSDTVSISLRDEATIGPLTLSGEIVRQYGRTHVVQGAIAASSVKRRAWGGHVSGRWDITDDGVKPYLQGRYIHFSGDRDSTRSSEAFDPMFFGWADWGQWWIGDMTSFQLPHANARSIVAEAGIKPGEAHSVRVLYFNNRLLHRYAFSSSRSWTHEVNAVYDLTINAHAFAGLMVGAAIPGRAAADYNGNDKTNYEVIAWMGFSF